MEHSFNIEIAKKYGIKEAIILNNLYFWIEKNRANNKHFYDGYIWTYNSKKSFAELFPYLTERQIKYSLEKLIDEGLVIKGNYNKLAYDRTLWYAITEKGYSILQNCPMEQTKLSNEKDKIVQPIPYINTDTKTDNICSSLADDFDKIWKIYPRKDGKNTAFNHYKSWLKGKKYVGRTVKLTNKQMWLATKKYADYIKEKKIEKQYIKMGSTFFNEAIMEYVEEE